MRLSTKAKDQAEADAKLDVLEKEIFSPPHPGSSTPLQELFYGYGDDNSMAKVAFDLLKQTGKTITAQKPDGWPVPSDSGRFSGAFQHLQQVVLSPIVWKKKARCCLFQLKSWSNME